MNLLNSIITSILIVALVWGGVLFLNSNANAIVQQTTQNVKTIVAESTEAAAVTPLNSDKDQTAAPQEPVNNTFKNQQLKIAGIQKNIALTDIHQLWLTFNSQSKLHDSLKVQPTKVYVLYSGITDSFQQADVTIGYDIKELKQHSNPFNLDMRHSEVILPAKPYTAAQLATAWEKIDYSKSVNFVLETHSLNKSGNTTSTTMLVSYL